MYINISHRGTYKLADELVNNLSRAIFIFERINRNMVAKSIIIQYESLGNSMEEQLYKGVNSSYPAPSLRSTNVVTKDITKMHTLE